MVKETLVGFFSDRREVEEALDELKSNGVLSSDISVLMQETNVPEEERHTPAGDTLAGAGAGTATGATFGGLLGALLGLGFSESDAQVYERRIRSGDSMVAVLLRDEPVDSDMTRAVFVKHHAQEVRMLHETVHA